MSAKNNLKMISQIEYVKQIKWKGNALLIISHSHIEVKKYTIL